MTTEFQQLPVDLPVSLIRGNTLPFPFVVVDEAEDGTETPKPLVGSSGKFAALYVATDEEFYTNTSFTFDNDGNGQFTVPPSATADWPVGDHRYYIDLTLPDGTVRTFFSGVLTVKKK